MKSGKRSILQKSCFYLVGAASTKVDPQLNQKCRCSINSNIPSLHHSNWGDAPNLRILLLFLAIFKSCGIVKHIEYLRLKIEDLRNSIYPNLLLYP